MNESFLPVRLHIKEQPQTFDRFNAQWTPTILLLDPQGIERHRIEGFLPVQDLLAQLQLGRAKIAFARSEFATAEDLFRSVRQRYGQSGAAAEASYWEGVAGYKASKDPRALEQAALRLKQEHPESEWARKASVWLA